MTNDPSSIDPTRRAIVQLREAMRAASGGDVVAAHEGEYGIAASDARLPDATHVGAVRLQVSDLPRSVAYYRDVLGLRVVRSDAATAALAPHGADRPLVELIERRGVSPIPRHGRLGLYHFAILLPDRAALGRFLAHLTERGVRAGASDHLVSEALYLHDPDGLGIEVYADRPREAWLRRGRELAMATEPLDAEAVTRAAGGERWTGMPRGTTMGHVHLHVGDLDAAAEFYHAALGLDVIVWSYSGALFLSAGGYHHHLGTNTWARGAEPAHDDDARLLDWALVLPSAADVEAVAARMASRGLDVRRDDRGFRVDDPWGTTMRVTV